MPAAKLKYVAIGILAGSIFLAMEILLFVYVTGNQSYHIKIARALVVGTTVALLAYMKARIRGLKIDYLTGLNRRLVAEEKLDQLSFARKDVTIAIVDVNGLRSLNNKAGHDTGDRLLKEVAHRLQSQFSTLKGRCRTTVARLGGDEFIVIAEHTSKHKMLDDLNACLGQPHPFGDFYLAAAGVARSRSGRARDALKCADMAMYRAKAVGYTAVMYDYKLDGIPNDTSTVLRPKNRLRDIGR